MKKVEVKRRFSIKRRKGVCVKRKRTKDRDNPVAS